MKSKDVVLNKKVEKFQKKHKIGLCLSGGGTRGFSYIGVFKAFEELGIKFDAVAGTSIGSMFAALYASGYTSAELSKMAKKIKMTDFKKSTLGFLPSKMDYLAGVLTGVLNVKKIEQLNIPCYAVAVDLKTGREIDFSSGDLVSIITGSCAIPGVYYPVKYRNFELIDGGTRNNIPADVLREHNCDFVVTIDCNSTRGGGTNSSNFFSQFATSIGIMMVNNSRLGLELSDLIISPDLKDFNSMKLVGVEQMIKEGYFATMKMKKELLALFSGKYKKRKFN